MTAITLPSAVRLPDLATGPAGGWHFDNDPKPTITVGKRLSPISYMEPAGVAMLSAWAAFQRERRDRILDFETVKTPYTRRVGLLSAFAGRDSPPRSREREFCLHDGSRANRTRSGPGCSARRSIISEFPSSRPPTRHATAWKISSATFSIMPKLKEAALT